MRSRIHLWQRIAGSENQRDERINYFHHDVLGSIRKIINHVKISQFSSNCKRLRTQHGVSGPQNATEKVKYTGKWEDSPTKVYYFGARCYDAELRRVMRLSR